MGFPGNECTPWTSASCKYYHVLCVLFLTDNFFFLRFICALLPLDQKRQELKQERDRGGRIGKSQTRDARSATALMQNITFSNKLVDFFLTKVNFLPGKK